MYVIMRKKLHFVRKVITAVNKYHINGNNVIKYTVYIEYCIPLNL